MLARVIDKSKLNYLNILFKDANKAFEFAESSIILIFSSKDNLPYSRLEILFY